MKQWGLYCSRCSARLPFRYQDMKCECGGTLLVEYDLELVARTLTKESLKQRYSSMWRYRELLPVEDSASIVSLGEGWTPLLRMPKWENKLSLKRLWIKREEQNPTGSFKSRGFSVAVSLLKEAGVTKAAVPSNGNAAGALAAYAGRAGIQAFVFIPMDCPSLIVDECPLYGATTILVDGFIHDAAAIIEAGRDEQGWVNVGTLKEPGRVEGKKTMGLELAEQLGWTFPDVIIYPTGGGSGIIGMWKAFMELKSMGFIQGDMPRFVCVQEEGCQPIVDGVHPVSTATSDDSGDDLPLLDGKIIPNPTGMRVPNPPDLPLLLSIVQQSGGTAIAVSKKQIADAILSLGADGISSSPEGAATWAAMLVLSDTGWLRASDSVVLFNTSHAMKYAKLGTSAAIPIIRTYDDYMIYRSL
ncbi:threonine synthase [Paenibacillus pectinilyticus]|uniref:Threonine synthase n=1 Tax=Paenibacillus pectinilyticus TaxID=512399 RepID=A0A1C0ZW75_9BACL|nr:threonine synthase [Paenibacillus pectinilyticus]OCT12356.1 threonine synthase [Paenibacillus pectinilyticus]